MKKFLIVCLLFVTGLAAAQIPKPKKNTFVNDYANLLTADDIKALNEKLYVIQKQAGVQVAIVLVKKVPSEFTIERFATRIGRKWHVGTKKRGVVYVAAIDDHLQRLAIAENLESTLTDQKCEEILAEMKPSYRNEDYNGGLTTLVNSIHTELIGPIATPAPVAKPVVAQQEAVTSASKEKGVPDFIKYGGLAIIIFVIYKLSTRKSGNNMDGFYRQRGNYGGGYGSGTVINNYNNNNGGGRWYRRPYGFWGSNRNNSYGSGGYSSTSEPQNRVSVDNNPSNWGNWGSGDSGDSGFSDSGSSSSRRSSSSSSSRSSSSSSDSSGFSDRGGSSGGGSSSGSSSSSGGATSSW